MQRLSLIFLFMSLLAQGKRDLVDQMVSCLRGVDPIMLQDLRDIAEHNYSKRNAPQLPAYRPLFDVYPSLHVIPHIALADLPTPVAKLENISAWSGNAQVYIKRDDQTGIVRNGKRLFGGNKVRKLEFLLADACALGCKTVLTFGCVGSNHAAATAFYAPLVGLRAVVMLQPAPNSHCMRRNIAVMQKSGADLHFCTTSPMRALGTSYVCARYALDNGSYPYCIPTGGSCPRGTLGYVNAAFELKQQIDQGLIPVPDVIYVASGSVSGGTAAGLVLGLCMVDLPTKVVAVAVEPDDKPDALQQAIEQLFHKTNDFICSYDSSCPRYVFPHDRLHAQTNFTGPHYAEFTHEGVEAMQRMMTLENVELDGVYTGKTFAALCDDLQKGLLDNQTVLFWNTFYACSFDEQEYDSSVLPLGLREFFVHDVQELDKNQAIGYN